MKTLATLIWALCALPSLIAGFTIGFLIRTLISGYGIAGLCFEPGKSFWEAASEVKKQYSTPKTP